MGAELKIDKLRNVMKMLSKKPPQARIGIFNDAKQAAIGAAHEFGTSTLPVRSFLRVPLTEELYKRVTSEAKFSKDDLANVVKTKSMRPWTEAVAKVAKDLVDDAFATGGFGKWAPTKQATGHAILVETGALRDSVSVIIEEGE